MNIREFSYNLQKLYSEMSDRFSLYQQEKGWLCLSGCGRCCLNPEIEASPYEMLPMALAIYDEGTIEEWMEKIQTSEQVTCLAYVPGDKNGEGRCGRYLQRPSVCRMFGVSGYKDKNAQLQLSICKYIKESYQLQSSTYNSDTSQAPLLVEWSYKLANLDQKLIQDKMPINQALLQALQKVALYAEYQQV